MQIKGTTFHVYEVNKVLATVVLGYSHPVIDNEGSFPLSPLPSLGCNSPYIASWHDVGTYW
jgi:hypothetical protein